MAIYSVVDTTLSGGIHEKMATAIASAGPVISGTLTILIPIIGGISKSLVKKGLMIYMVNGTK
jgi:hypothetical protein